MKLKKIQKLVDECKSIEKLGGNFKTNLSKVQKEVDKLRDGVVLKNVRRIIDTGKYTDGVSFTQSNKNILQIEVHSFENYIGNCLKIGDKVSIVHYNKK